MKSDVTRLSWFNSEMRWLLIRARHVFTGEYRIDYENYAGKGNALHTAQEGNAYLRDKIVSGEPFAAGRCSYTEFGIIACAQNERFYNSKIHYLWTPSYINGLKEYVLEGSNSKGIQKFYDIYMEAIDTVDAVGCFTNMVMADTILKMSDTIDTKYLYHADTVSPCSCDDNSWTWALSGKKVLVVNPFAELIEKQYHYIDKIWPNGMMNGIEIQTDSSIWWKNCGDNTWFTIFENLSDRVLARDFDVAILGCGSFGFPLAARIKKSGRQAIHMGGATQLLFGLKGKRWDSCGYYNEYWIRPGEETKPSYANALDGATYW